MTTVLLDTHGRAWAINALQLLSTRTAEVRQSTDHTLISPATVDGHAQQASLGRRRRMLAMRGWLPGAVGDRGGKVAAFATRICCRAGRADWLDRDPFDRLIAATALALEVPVVTKNRALASIPGLRCIC